MLLHLTEMSAEPLHSQIRRQLIEKIIEGELGDGAKLLPIRALARSQHVSMNTVKRAYGDLERDGLIKSKQENGFYVTSLTPEQRQAITMQKLLGSHSHLNMVEAFSKQLMSVFDPEKIRGIIADNIKKHLLVKSVFFVLYNDQNDEYAILPCNEFPKKFAISRDDSLLNSINHVTVPVPIKAMQTNAKESTLFEELLARDVKIISPLSEAQQFLGLLALTGKINGARYSAEELNLLTVLAIQYVTALRTARFYVEAAEKRLMKEELTMAQKIQAGLLPQELPDNEDFSIAAYSDSSSSVGGDFYDYLPIDETRFGLVIADACGNGLPAAMLISQIHAMLKSEINNGKELPSILENMNEQLVSSTPKDKFATLFYSVFDVTESELQYATAGHDYPIVVRKDGSVESLQATGPALGIRRNSTYETGVVKLNGGDFIFFYTDGVTETMNERKQEYGEKRLLKLLIGSRHLDSQSIVDAVLRDLNCFCGDNLPRDDRTVMVLRVKK
ncbi:MAG: SpoIIE family protein phosphatase [bacterium]